MRQNKCEQTETHVTIRPNRQRTVQHSPKLRSLVTEAAVIHMRSIGAFGTTDLCLRIELMGVHVVTAKPRQRCEDGVLAVDALEILLRAVGVRGLDAMR